MQAEQQMKEQLQQLEQQAQETQMVKQEAQALQELLQATKQQVQDAKAAKQAAETFHHAELDHLQQDLVLAQQQLAQEASKRHRAGQRGPGRAVLRGLSEDRILSAR